MGRVFFLFKGESLRCSLFHLAFHFNIWRFLNVFLFEGRGKNNTVLCVVRKSEEKESSGSKMDAGMHTKEEGRLG